MLSVSRLLRARRNAILEAEGMSEGNDAFLFLLSREDGITMGVIAEKLAIGAPSATKIATKLEELGLIRRESSRIDSRQNHAWLTGQGQETASRLAAAYHAMDGEIMARMRGKDTERLEKILTRLEASAEGRDPSLAGKPPKGGKKKKKA